MNNSYITIIKEKRTVLSRKRVPLNQNECTADFRIGVPFEQNLHRYVNNILVTICNNICQPLIYRFNFHNLYYTSISNLSKSTISSDIDINSELCDIKIIILSLFI